MSVTYTAVLDVSEDGVGFVAGLLEAERRRRGTRADTRALTVREQAVLVLRWFLDDTRMVTLARDHAVSRSTAYTYRDEAIAVLAARKSSLHGALLAAKVAGHSHVILDGTLIATDRNATPGPTAGVDLWWSGKHHHHGGNVQVVSAPDGWPLWISQVRPGREHDTTAARADPDLLAQIRAWVEDGLLGLADLGYEGEADLLRIPIKKTKDAVLTADQQTYNTVHGALRCLGERANSLLKTTFKVLRRYRGCPWRIGDIAAAALVLLHIEHGRNLTDTPKITEGDQQVARKGSVAPKHTHSQLKASRTSRAPARRRCATSRATSQSQTML